MNRVFTGVLLIVISASGAAQEAWRLPATIEALQDIRERDTKAPGGRGVLDVEAVRGVPRVNGRWQWPDPILIRKGQRFQMTAIGREGACTIKVDALEIDVTSCSWLDGFTDRQEDFYKVVSGRTKQRNR